MPDNFQQPKKQPRLGPDVRVVRVICFRVAAYIALPVQKAPEAIFRYFPDPPSDPKAPA